MKKRTKNTVLKGAVALLVAGVLTAGVCCMGYAARGENGKWFGNSDVKTWHWKEKTDDKKPDDGTEDPSDQEEEENGGTVVAEGESNGVSLLSAKLPRSAYAANGISAQAESAYTLTAKVMPPNATVSGYVWSVDFTNSASEWASGKNVADYITLTSDGNTATFAVLEAFGEQFTIKVEVQDVEFSEEEVAALEAETEEADAPKFATYTVDYAQRVSLPRAHLGKVLYFDRGLNVRIGFGTTDAAGGGTYYVDTTESEVYTLAEEFTVTTTVVQASFCPNGEHEFQGEVGKIVNEGDYINFDFRFFEYFGIGNQQLGNYGDIFNYDSITYGPTDACIGQTLVTLEVKLLGKYNSETKSCSIKLSSYVICSNSVEIEEGSGTVV